MLRSIRVSKSLQVALTTMRLLPLSSTLSSSLQSASSIIISNINYHQSLFLSLSSRFHSQLLSSLSWSSIIVMSCQFAIHLSEENISIAVVLISLSLLRCDTWNFCQCHWWYWIKLLQKKNFEVDELIKQTTVQWHIELHLTNPISTH